MVGKLPEGRMEVKLEDRRPAGAVGACPDRPGGRGDRLPRGSRHKPVPSRRAHPFALRRDGRVEMRLETTGRKELVRWVLSWMPDLKVLAPKSLRDRIAEKLRDGLRAQE